MGDMNELLRTRERQKLLDELIAGLVQHAFDTGMFRSCLNCAHWSGEPSEICNLFVARPPARVIVTGCDEHTDNIPF